MKTVETASVCTVCGAHRSRPDGCDECVREEYRQTVGRIALVLGLYPTASLAEVEDEIEHLQEERRRNATHASRAEHIAHERGREIVRLKNVIRVGGAMLRAEVVALGGGVRLPCSNCGGAAGVGHVCV